MRTAISTDARWHVAPRGSASGKARRVPRRRRAGANRSRLTRRRARGGSGRRASRCAVATASFSATSRACSRARRPIGVAGLPREQSLHEVDACRRRTLTELAASPRSNSWATDPRDRADGPPCTAERERETPETEPIRARAIHESTPFSCASATRRDLGARARTHFVGVRAPTRAGKTGGAAEHAHAAARSMVRDSRSRRGRIGCPSRPRRQARQFGARATDRRGRRASRRATRSRSLFDQARGPIRSAPEVPPSFRSRKSPSEYAAAVAALELARDRDPLAIS